MARTISVSERTFASIWTRWRPGDACEDDILRRVLAEVGPKADWEPRGVGDENLTEKRHGLDSHKRHGQRVRHRRHPGKVRWVDDVRSALVMLGGEGDLPDIYRLVRGIRERASRTIATNFEATIRQTIQSHSSSSKNFEGREDLFERVTDGRWKIRNS
jgi:hypothetical protein